MDKGEDEAVDSGHPPQSTRRRFRRKNPPPPKRPRKPKRWKRSKETEALEEVKETERSRSIIFADEKKADMTPLFLTAGVLGLAVVLLLIAWAGLWNYSTAVYVTGLTFIPLLLWMGRKTNTVYTVFLGCVIAVLMTCIYCLWAVLAQYHFDVKASEAKQRVGMAQPVDRGWQLAASTDMANTFGEC